MSDDLSAFFAKKKDKKKKAAVKIEDVGQALERRAKRQEEYEQEQDEHHHIENNQKRNNAGDDDKNANAEESEWIEYGDNYQGRLEGLKIKDMGLENDDAQADNNEPEDSEVHETKTWGQINSEKKATEEPERAVTITDKQMAAAYKPPIPGSRRGPGGLRQQTANFDVSNDQLFPSLADASKIEKSKKDDVKANNGWVKAGGSNENRGVRGYTVTTGSGRESALAAVKNMNATAPAPVRQPIQINPPSNPPAPTPTPAPKVTAAAPTPVSTAPAAGSYLPPHLRKK
ncbi:unnamed protein product [Caenorhabditis angaria]|uniref:Uncharacterized protein n=1 Tax=Caenorhabditis angaria TaxID=860376 RepID=A0A9P1ILX1_9PELO|nr:unnamed protein product [Caenorhabditis angaria]